MPFARPFQQNPSLKWVKRFVVGLVIIVWARLIIAAPADGLAEKVSHPINVLMIVIDDLGWADLGCYGSTYHRSPHLDHLAAQSLRFTQAYAAAPVCTPTRAAILTGKSPARLDMTIWHEGAVDGGPGDRLLRNAKSAPNLSHDEVTLAELFHRRGYLTAHVGKWHLGTAAYYPETQGFDLNLGGTFWGAPSTFFFPFAGPWSQSNPEPRYVPNLAPGKPGDYLPDRLTDKAIDVLSEIDGQPFYMNLWYYTVHSPIEAPASLVETCRQRPTGQHQKDPTYAAMVERMDHNIGRVLETLDTLGLRENTVVIVTSDNGGVDFPVRGITPTSNYPLRSGKGTLYEGGLRIPLIIRWPGRTRKGTTCNTVVTSQDFFPTLVDAFRLGTNNVDGISLLNLLTEPSTELDRRTLYWHYPHYYVRTTPCSAIRDGDWKLIHFYERNEVQLYDLAVDIGEQQDRSQTDAGRAGELLDRLIQWRSEVGANSPTRNKNR